MDCNAFYHRQQISLLRADAAACDPSRSAHLGLADLYAARSARARAGRLAPAARYAGAHRASRT